MAAQRSSASQSQSRFIRVFVSSTFRDMQAERDELVKFIFPQLRKLCQQRGVTWGQVDLRWGISDEQKAEGKVLPICLEEIHRCRPYFIAMLGERYGWTNYEVPPYMTKREPWLSQYKGHSVTELEILHGVLNDPGMAERSFFYFRDPKYLETLSPRERQDFVENDLPEDIQIYGPADAHRRSEQRRQKLIDLKERIRKSGFPVYENYPDPREFGQAVLQDLTAVIDNLYPKGSGIDQLDQEAIEHEVFANSRAQVYIGRKVYFDRLDAHARSQDEPLVVLGESGSGKSALLANWGIKYQQKYPRELVLMHFIGATPGSASWTTMLRRILGELKRKTNLPGEIPDQPDDLRTAFTSGLNNIPESTRVVLVLDALNQLDDENGASDLLWLPTRIPRNVRIVLSTLPGRPLNELKRRGWPVLTVESLIPDERKQLIKEYLALSTKVLDNAQTEHIANALQCSNPLFLRVLLDELQLLGMHETLDARIDAYLEAETIPALYGMILNRCEEDYERDRPRLVSEAMSLLWAARRGLSENELMELIGSNGQPMPQAYWSPFYLAMEQSFLNRAGLIGFSHDYLRQAVKTSYLKDEILQQQTHLRLADYFEAQYSALPQELEAYFKTHSPLEIGDINTRFSLASLRLEELPWQLVQAEAWERLVTLLGDLNFFMDAWNVNYFDLMTYWVQVENNSPYRMLDTYRDVIEHPDQYQDYLEKLGNLLGETGHPREALELRDYLVAYYEKTGDKDKLRTSLGNKGISLMELGDLAGAMALHKEQENLAYEKGDEQTLSVTLTNQASILYIQGDLDGAMALYEKAEAFCRKIGDREGLSRIFGNKALVLYVRGDLQESMALHKEEERLCREQGDMDGLHTSLGNQALILKDLGDLDKAMVLHKEEERLCFETGNKDGLQHSFGNQAVILQKRGDLDGAMKLHKEKERICRELGNKPDLSDALGNQANILYERGDLDGAMTLHKEEERLAREVGDKDGLALSLGNQALILKDRGDVESAMALHKEEESLYREVGNRGGIQRSLYNQSITHIPQIRPSSGEDLAATLAQHKEDERLARDQGDKNVLANCLIRQAAFLAGKMNNPHRAFLLANEAYRLVSATGQADLIKQIEAVRTQIRDQL